MATDTDTYTAPGNDTDTDTDTWQRTRDATVAWWRRARANESEAAAVGAALDATRPQILAARQAGDKETEQALVGAWRLRLQHLLHDDPDLTTQLRTLLEDHLTPPLTADERIQIGSLVIKATRCGHTRALQEAHDQHER